MYIIEGILLWKATSTDRDLEGYAYVVRDEVYEANAYAGLLLALLKSIVTCRGDLRPSTRKAMTNSESACRNWSRSRIGLHSEVVPGSRLTAEGRLATVSRLYVHMKCSIVLAVSLSATRLSLRAAVCPMQHAISKFHGKRRLFRGGCDPASSSLSVIFRSQLVTLGNFRIGTSFCKLVSSSSRVPIEEHDPESDESQ